ncbi:MAG: 3' terminal RNA ribose 2'-O-methyltransferase Hen1, partial [Nakamurella sp.]
MLLTVTSTAPNATDLGYLLHKHPARLQSFELSVGTAHVFYPEATDSRCTAALLLEVDPIALVRNRRFGGDGFALAQYVNDRPYAASSMLAVALGRVFGSALRGECKARPELLGVPLPLTIRLPAVPCRGGALAGELFGPLGWTVDAPVVPLDPQVPRWGDSRYVDLTLTGSLTLADALTQLYVLLPVLDGAKHYWVSGDEIDKLMLRGGRWLQSHPLRELIAQRYLAHQRSYV